MARSGVRSIGAAEAAAAALEAQAGGRAVAIVTVVEGDAVPPGVRLLRFEDGEVRGGSGDPGLDAALEARGEAALRGAGAGTTVLTIDAMRCCVYAEAHRPSERLFVVGAGHVGAALARLGAMVGFEVTVLDDRADFAVADRLPGAAVVLRTDFADPFRDAIPDARSCVVLVTRAHRYDFDCLRRLLDLETPPRYIGMIGSRRRVRAAFQALLDSAMPRELLARISAPVGLDLGAETPEEIALSIVAELVQLRRGGDGTRLAVKNSILDRLLPERPEVEESDAG